MSKSHSKTTDSSPIKTKKDILEEINQLLNKGESYDKEIQILNNNKDKILKEQQSLKKIVQHGDESRLSSLERKNKQIENIENEISTNKNYKHKIIKKIEKKVLILQEGNFLPDEQEWLLQLPKAPTKSLRKTGRGIKKHKKKKTKKKKTKKK